MENKETKKQKKDIKVITGNGQNLNISPVYNHLKIDKPENNVNNNKNKKIIVPKTQK